MNWKTNHPFLNNVVSEKRFTIKKMQYLIDNLSQTFWKLTFILLNHLISFSCLSLIHIVLENPHGFVWFKNKIKVQYWKTTKTFSQIVKANCNIILFSHYSINEEMYDSLNQYCLQSFYIKKEMSCAAKLSKCVWCVYSVEGARTWVPRGCA